MNILFIYNNLNELSAIEQNLINAGHKMYIARNYSEASDILLRIKIDLIICDLLSEKIDGIQILRRVKSSQNLSRIPFIILSSTLKDDEDIAFFKKLGAAAILEKPITYKGFQTLIEKDLISQKLGFDSKNRVISDEEFIEEYSEILTRRIQKRVKEIEADQLFIYNLINTIPTAIFLINNEFHITEINDAGMKYLGIKDKNEIKDKFCYSLLYKSNRVCNFEGHRCPILGVIQEKNSTDHYFIFGDEQNKKHLNIHFAPVLNPQNNTILMLEHIIDNTGTIEVINKSRENEFKLETILSESRYGIILIENDKILNINQMAIDFLQMKEPTQKGFINALGQILYEEIIDEIDQNIISRKEIFTGQGDKEHILIVEAQKIRSLNRTFILFIIYDNTEHYRLFKTVKDNELLLRTILNNIQDIFILIHNNKIIEINNQIEKITGKPGESFLRQNLFSSLPFIKESYLVNTDKKEITLQSASGKDLIFSMKIYNLNILGEKQILLQLSDITEAKEKEKSEKAKQEKINYIDRIEVVAKMNKGVTQNINNFLAGINNLAEYMVRSDVDPAKVKMTVNFIKKLTKNASNLLSKISGLIGINNDKLRSFDIQDLIDDLIDLIKYPLPQNIELNIKRNSSNNTIKGDYTSILQAILNIVINAYEAMPDGGKIIIDTSDINLDVEKKIQIKISDTGRGIPEDIKNNIFLPYYSSKQILGTGLGLSVAYNTIINHKGTISFESIPDKGTTFTITLPTCSEPIDSGRYIQSGNKEKICIISQNYLERELIKRILIKNNYNAYTTVDSLDAIESIKISKPDLIIIDSELSRLSVEDTLNRIYEIYPSINIVLYTGFIFDERVINLCLKGIKSIIYKPLDINELIDTINNLLIKIGLNDINQKVDKPRDPRRILIIDDEEYILSALKMNLSDENEIVIDTSSTKALDRLLNNERFDKYIIDINMPDLNGFEFYNMLKEIDPDVKHKVIFITGGITSESMLQELDKIREEVYLIEKPFDIEELIKILSQ